ncbi:MAG: hypothetical protein AB1896_07880 [Thermodesulfobacteriota bacterium]
MAPDATRGTMPLINEKFKLLAVLEDAFDRYVRERYNFACAEKCAACCTDAVTATTLEAARLERALEAAGREDLCRRLVQSAKGELFRPRITTNTMAYACLSRRDPPEETPPAAAGPCPLLEDGLCPVYEARPFSCRGMFARKKCVPGAEAEMPAELVTLVTLCWQIIEHLDAGGLYGNLADLARTLSEANQAFNYQTGGQLAARGLPPTRPVPGFLVPPEQETAVQAFLSPLFATDCGGRTFRQRLAEVRPSPF